MAEKIIFTWSGGKDSAMALYELQRTHSYEVSALLTTITEDYERISMHGVRRILLERQADSLGLSLEKVFISKNTSNEEYESKMQEALIKYRATGVPSVVFGDIFLEDLRKYREDNLSKVDMKGIFPIWKRDTTELAHTFIDLGFKAVVTCVDSNVLDKKFVGRVFEEQFLSELPSTVDPCGENGEFHSFVYDGPIFRERIAFTMGDIVLRDNRFYFCDLIPVR
ncbi:MAG: diphthine--ammonia ligase [Thermodesulfovibrionales bacterium]